MGPTRPAASQNGEQRGRVQGVWLYWVLDDQGELDSPFAREHDAVELEVEDQHV